MLSRGQKKLVEDNMNLVYSVAKQMNVLMNKDAVQEGFMGLCNAAKNFDINKAQFSTFAYSYIRGYIHTFLNKDCVVKPLRTHNDGFKFCNIVEYNADVHDVECKENIDDIMIIKDIMARADATTKLVLKLYYMGYTQQEIGEKLKMSQVTVCKKIKKLAKEILL